MISEVYNMDCVEGMKHYPDKFFDLAIVDPPYGNNADREHTEGNGWVRRKSNGWDKNPPDEEYFLELYRVSKNQIVWGANYMINNLFPSMGWIFWDKGQRNFSLADGELAWTSFHRALRVFEYSRGKMQAESERIHPTQKPIQLYKWLLQNYAKPGDKILDTHMGSQSSRIAAHEMGFDYWGFEIDKEYFDDGNKRFDNHKAQIKLFPA